MGDHSVSQPSLGSVIVNRFVVTAEVIVSKIFPAGFGWQGASVVAGQYGYEATDLGFFLMTGVGDAIGVGLGHFGYMCLKKGATGNGDLNQEFGTATLLSTACIFSGTAWQPIVNFLHDTAHLPFDPTAAGVVVGCGSMFFIGLRFARATWSKVLSTVAPASYANLKADAQLSLSVGGATGCFVGTDVSFGEGAADTNWLRPVVGIEDGTDDLTGMAIAGTSTGLGFAAFQSTQNVV